MTTSSSQVVTERPSQEPPRKGRTVLAACRSRLGRAVAPRAAGIVYALVLLVAVLSILSATSGRPPYTSDINVQNILSQTAVVGLLAIFTTIVLVSGNFDLSIASTAALAGSVALLAVDPLGPVIAAVLGLVVGLVVGLVNGLLVQFLGINAFVVTLGMLTAVRGVQFVILDGKNVSAENPAFLDLYNAVWECPRWLGGVAAAACLLGGGAMLTRAATSRTAYVGTPLAVVALGLGVGWVTIVRPGLLDQGLPVWLMLGAMTIAAVVLRFTVWGRNLYAVGSNAEAARLSGVRVSAYKIGAFMLNGLMAALAGLLFAGHFNSIDTQGMTGFELTAITAAILGGTSLFGGAGFVTKTVAGAVLLFTLVNGFNVLNIGSNYQGLVQGVVLIGAAALYTVTTLRTRRPKPVDPAVAPRASS